MKDGDWLDLLFMDELRNELFYLTVVDDDETVK